MRTPDPNEPIAMSAPEVREHLIEVDSRVARGVGRVIVGKRGAPGVGVASMADLPNRSREGLDRIQSCFDGIPGDAWEREVDETFDKIKADRRNVATSQDRYCHMKAVPDYHVLVWEESS